MNCRRCGGPVSVPGNRCPTCGARKPWMRLSSFIYDQVMWVAASISIAGLIAIFGGYFYLVFF